MKILVLDPYPDRPYRISKDTIGGFGTANRFGDGWPSRAITWLFAREVDWPPMHSMYAAGVLRHQGNDVAYARTWTDGGDCDLCLVTSSIVCHETEVETIRRVAASGTPVGVIGPFARVVPSPYLEAGAFIVSGEPEMYFMRHPLTADTVGTLEGVLGEAEPVALDDLPLPAWDLIFSEHPPRFGLMGKKHVVLPIVATRGCPFSCFNYCAYPLQQGRKVRTRSPEKIVEEMIHWEETVGVSYFIFRDPVFGIDRKQTLALCDALEKSGRPFKFIIESHLKSLDLELCKRLRDVGLDMVKVGIESINTEVLKSSKRFAIDRDEQSERIRSLEKLGIKITCHYIVAMPGDSIESCHRTLGYARRLNTLFAQISVFTPYPGTPAFKEFEDRILVDNYESFTQYDLVFRHEAMSPPDVRKLLGDVYRDYYLRIPWMFKFLRAWFA